jgi:hypothetical protein
MNTVGLGLGSLACEAIFGYVGTAIFTTINPLIGAGFGVTSSIITTVAREILNNNTKFDPLVKSILSNTVGVLAGAALVGAITGVALTPMIGVCLFISILAAKVIWNLATLACTECLKA